VPQLTELLTGRGINFFFITDGYKITGVNKGSGRKLLPLYSSQSSFTTFFAFKI